MADGRVRGYQRCFSQAARLVKCRMRYFRSMTKREYNFIAAFALAAPVIEYALHRVQLEMVDFTTVFYPVAQTPLHPYAVPGFISPPWTALLIAPFAIIPYGIGRVLISLVNLLVAGLLVLKYGGGKLALLVTLTSYPVLFLLGSGSVEFLPMLGMLLNWPILILVKPQSGALALLIWFKRAKNKLAFALCMAALLGVSLLVWWNWPWLMLENIRTLPAALASPLNKINLWPWGIPVGLVALYAAWKQDDELLAIVATWLLSPHVVYHSLAMGLALLSARRPRLALVVSVALYAIAAARWYLAGLS